MKVFLTWVENNDNLILAITAILALFVSGLSIFLTFKTLKTQKKHNKISVRPIGEVGLGDYENVLFVSLRNVGLGPLIIKKVSVFDGENSIEKPLIKFMPDLVDGYAWETFRGDVSKRALAAGSDISLIKLSGEVTNPAFVKNRDNVRKQLAKLSVIFEYTDMYETESLIENQNLLWFERNVYP